MRNEGLSYSYFAQTRSEAVILGFQPAVGITQELLSLSEVLFMSI